jgi:hypothetical protein
MTPKMAGVTVCCIQHFLHLHFLSLDVFDEDTRKVCVLEDRRGVQEWRAGCTATSRAIPSQSFDRKKWCDRMCWSNYTIK